MGSSGCQVKALCETFFNNLKRTNIDIEKIHPLRKVCNESLYFPENKNSGEIIDSNTSDHLIRISVPKIKLSWCYSCVASNRRSSGAVRFGVNWRIGWETYGFISLSVLNTVRPTAKQHLGQYGPGFPWWSELKDKSWKAPLRSPLLCWTAKLTFTN